MPVEMNITSALKLQAPVLGGNVFVLLGHLFYMSFSLSTDSFCCAFLLCLHLLRISMYFAPK